MRALINVSDKNISQIAKLAECSQSAICHWANHPAARMINEKSLLKISDVLGCRPIDIAPTYSKDYVPTGRIKQNIDLPRKTAVHADKLKSVLEKFGKEKRYQLANHMRVGSDTLGEYMSCKTKCRMIRLELAAEFLGCSIFDLSSELSQTKPPIEAAPTIFVCNNREDALSMIDIAISFLKKSA